MAEILLNPIAINSNATATSIARRIFYGLSNVNTSAAVNGKLVNVIKSASVLNANATVPLTSFRIIKYTKAAPIGKATVVSQAHKYKTFKEDLRSEAKLEAFLFDRDIRESMFGYLPPFYQEFKDFRSLIGSEANEFTRLNAKLEELLLQFFITTATYSLDDWENFTNVRQRGTTVSLRRTEVKKKVNGIGTVTPKALKAIMNAFYESEMIEIPLPGVIRFKIKGKRGIPDNLSDIESAVNDVLPSHLQPEFVFTYLPWSEVEESGLVWTEADTYTYKGLEEVFLIEPTYPYQN
jgi:hypothetical protein